MPFDLELALVIAAAVTGFIIVLEFLWLKKRRLETSTSAMVDSQSKQPVIVEYAVSFFPVLLIVLVLRSFLFEPFHIPSGSMRPNLLVGDFILVNKFAYGVRLPVIHTKVIDRAGPKRGDVVVFRHPIQPERDYIKRLIGLPGDSIQYRDKQLTINGELVEVDFSHDYEPANGITDDFSSRVFNEDLLGVEHLMMTHPQKNLARGFDIVVPENEYFMMGDNRDNSADSRSWGFVPEKNLVGKAMFIWMNFNLGQRSFNFKRIGT